MRTDEANRHFSRLYERTQQRARGGEGGGMKLLCHTLVYRTENSGRVWKLYIERFTICGIFTHAYRLFTNRERYCVPVRQQNNKNIFECLRSDGSLKGLTVVGLVVQTSAQLTQKTPVPRPKQTP
jgi:hypothetical protein